MLNFSQIAQRGAALVSAIALSAVLIAGTVTMPTQARADTRSASPAPAAAPAAAYMGVVA